MTCRRSGLDRAALLAVLTVFAALTEGRPPQSQPNLSADTQLPLVPGRRIQFATTEGSWLGLDLSPDDQSILFDLLGDIYSVSSAGGQAQRLTEGMAFDTQPIWSPDGRAIAFVSDRSGSDNLWIMGPHGERPRRVSDWSGYSILTSPAWSVDGQSLFVSSYRTDIAAFEIWQFATTGTGHGELIVSAKPGEHDKCAPTRSSVGSWPSPDGRFLYFARNLGGDREDRAPSWTIVRHDLHSGEEQTEVLAPSSPRSDLVAGNYFRPAVSPDGHFLVYASRHEGRTGLRIRDLQSLEERWLVYPIQHDQLRAEPFRDLEPRYDFTADGQHIVLAIDGHIYRVGIRDGSSREIPFKADVDIGVGPSLRVDIKEETGPVRARIIQTPTSSPDGKLVAFSALGKIYVMELRAGATPKRLTRDDRQEFMPSWSPDGQRLVYVTWTAKDAGDIWVARMDAREAPRRISSSRAFYTNPVFTPNGAAIIVERSSQDARMHAYMEYGALRDSDLMLMPLQGAEPRTIAHGKIGGLPHFTTDPGATFVNFEDGLNRVALDGSGHQRAVSSVGPGWYFAEGPAAVDDLRISPDGQWALAQIAQQLHLIEVPAPGAQPVNLTAPSVRHRKITDVGADFFGWSHDGRTVEWAIGSSFYRQPLEQISLDPPGATPRMADVPLSRRKGAERYDAVITLPRDTPSGTLLLRGATIITMKGDEIISEGDVLIINDHIAAVGTSGTIPFPRNTTVRDVRGRYIIPGLIDEHDHYAEVRRGVLDFETWGPRANLAYGVTTGFDPSTLTIDMLAYQDAVDAGLMVGSRMPSTGVALFSFNDFRSLDDVRAVLRRYRDHYRTLNLKEYRVGNRRVRQWVAIAARELGMMPTTEGADSAELDLTQIIDGFAGNEHALPIVPLSRDIVELMERTRVAYSPTLTIAPTPDAQEYFLAHESVAADPKLNRFYPRFVLDIRTRQQMHREISEYLFPAVAESATKVLRAGGLIGMGSHGEMPGRGLHWEMQAHVMGGMSPLEALRSATMGSAETIGRAREFGSIEPGKYADLVILAKDPRLDIRNTLSIQQVMKNGRLYDGDTLDELWPRRHTLSEPWFHTDEPQLNQNQRAGNGTLRGQISSRVPAS